MLTVCVANYSPSNDCQFSSLIAVPCNAAKLPKRHGVPGPTKSPVGGTLVSGLSGASVHSAGSATGGARMPGMVRDR